MIFVPLGTHHDPFPRLIEGLQELDRDDLVVQYGEQPELDVEYGGELVGRVRSRNSFTAVKVFRDPCRPSVPVRPEVSKGSGGLKQQRERETT